MPLGHLTSTSVKACCNPWKQVCRLCLIQMDRSETMDLTCGRRGETYEGETLIALDLRAGEAKLGLGRRPESWEWSRWVQTARTIHLDRFSAQTIDSGHSSGQILCFWAGPDFGRDLTSPVAAGKSCRRRFFSGETRHPGFDKPCCCWEVLPQAPFFR